MPNWKKVIVSGSDSSLNSLYVSTSVTASVFSGSSFSGSFSGSLFGPHIGSLSGTSSWSTNASTASNVLPLTQSFIISGSSTFIGSTFFTGSLNAPTITGSILGTASYAANADLLDGVHLSTLATTGSNLFVGTQTITGSLNLSGSQVSISASLVATSITGSHFGTSSWALNARTASYVSDISQSVLISGSLTITGSFRVLGSISATTMTASVFSGSFSGSHFGTSSRAITASYSDTLPLRFQAGRISGSVFLPTAVTAGTNKSASVTLTPAFPSPSYSVSIVGDSDSRAWAIKSRTTSSFVIISNSNIVISGSVFWTAISHGNI
jgi:hypothetical protein